MNLMEIMQQFAQFKQAFMQQNPGVNPQTIVQQMLNNGQMSQQQFEQVRNLANMLMGRK